jgi:hypothetical protein
LRDFRNQKRGAEKIAEKLVCGPADGVPEPIRGIGYEGVEHDAPLRRPPLILPAIIAEIVEKTTRETPEGGTHISTRRLAHAAGVSPSAVGRVWWAPGKRISMA